MPRWLRQWVYVQLAERGLCTEQQADLGHKEGVLQGAIVALRLLRGAGITRENVDLLEASFAEQLKEARRARLSDVGLEDLKGDTLE